MYKKGEIYLAKLNPKKGNEVGKIRPILIYQTNLLNECEHPTTIILPISTVLIDGAYPLRYRVNSRDSLEKNSDILCDQLRAIDNDRITSEILTKLTYREILEVDKQISIVLGIEF
ncbi:MAG: type II toxin-antitoxin system PemK/MazF family toxin [Helicobacteraceae bacterium]|nr:type II toxin-antitoxin system PemK/MazF family toxin [Helicobacteraceae bacterium]